MKFCSPLGFACALMPLAMARPALCVSITSPTHPASVVQDFDGGNVPFKAFQKEGGVAPGTRFTLENGALTITNAYAGSFGVDTQVAPFDADKFSHVVFDYAIKPDVKVNVFFRLRDGGLYHGAIFTGPDSVRAGSVLLGTIPGVVTDGKWHRANIPLRAWLRKLYPNKTTLMIDQIVIGNWDNSNYLMALGVAGNGAGVSWKMDNFAVLGVGPAEAKFEIKADDGSALKNAQEYSYAVDEGPATPLASPAISLTPTAGFHRLQIYDKNKHSAGAYGFYVAPDAPRIGKPELVENSVRIPIETTAGLDVASLKLTVGIQSFQLDSPYLTWDGASGVLELQAADAGLQWPDGASIPLKIEGVRDVIGRNAPTLNASLSMIYARHQAVPPLPILAAMQSMGTGSFENSLEEWAPKTDWPGAAVVERDDETAASGRFSVRLTAPINAGNFGAVIRRTAFDVAKFPVIEFDYRIPPELRTDFVFFWGNQTYSVGFTDRTPQYKRVGSVSNVIADGKWHHAQIRLYDGMRAERPDAADFKIDWLALADSGWLGNPKGLCFWIDNFQFSPVTKGAPFRSRVLISDVTGLKGVSWVLDESPQTTPPATVKAENSVEATSEGAKWVHLRAANGAGLWSATSHLPFVLDVKPPQVGTPLPANGERSAASTLEIPVTDDVGVDLSSLSLVLQGREYNVRTAEMSYQNNRILFSLDRAAQDGRFVPLANGATITWQLNDVADIAGQTTRGTRGEWIYDYALDKSGPLCSLTSSTHKALQLSSNIVKNVADPNVWSGLNLKVEAATRAENDSRPVIRATPTADNTTFALRMRRGWDISKNPLLGFSYKLREGQKLYLRLQSARGRYAIKLQGDVPTIEVLGEIAGIKADGQWHWAQINLEPFKDKLGTLVAMLEFADDSGKGQIKSPIEIGDFTLQSAPAGNVKLNWKAGDLSGIQQYRFAWDQSPTTIPTETTAVTTREVTGSSGTWWAHVQAQDRAGNWGAVDHLAILMP